ncbi:uroporphyrinogen-III synthase [Virgisporangium ochraceum]|uniref:uroporphyrinogen-III synthase n=1 Tax=Virgisporangium ochraceum TaxID=65505 RepID=UPI001EF31A17|nr:uroporphyrinogen-III synthase [Virgisporangium ochraceum]
MSGAEDGTSGRNTGAPGGTPLVGFTIAITAERRRDEQAVLLERRGARVVRVPVITHVPLLDDEALHAATEECIEDPPDLVVVTTGIGFRGWLEAAEGWDLGGALRVSLAGATLIARGAKPCGAIRAAGLSEGWSASSESMGEILDRLLAEGVAGRRIAVQLHGGVQEDFVEALRAAGADVVEVSVYRYRLPDDPAPLRRLVDQVLAGRFDAVTFTSAPAVNALLEVAGADAPELLRSFDGRVLAACVGPVTAAPLLKAGVPALVPDRSRLGALVRSVTDELPRRALRLRVDDCVLEIRGHAVVVDGDVRLLAPASMTALGVLAARPGAVVSRAALAAALPSGAGRTGWSGADGGDGHAVDVAVARLRAALGSARFIETVVKRGYRLRVDET